MGDDASKITDREAPVAACVLASVGRPVETAWQAIQHARGMSVPDTPEQRGWVNGLVELSNRGPPE
jgi:hypothetical protein